MFWDKSALRERCIQYAISQCKETASAFFLINQAEEIRQYIEEGYESVRADRRVENEVAA